MRETTAKALALTTGVLLLGAVFLFASLQGGRIPTAAEAAGLSGAAAPSPLDGMPEPEGGVAGSLLQVPDSVILAGRGVYDELGCAGCHSIAGVGSPRSPLDQVGSRLTAEVIRLWIVDPQAARPGIRKPAFDDVPEADINALVVYLGSLK